MTKFVIVLRTLFFASLFGSACAYSSSFGVATKRSVMTMRRGRGSFRPKNEGPPNSASSGVMGGARDAPPLTGSRWVPVAGLTVSDLPQEQNKVQLVDTMADPLMNAATNPNGAVSIAKYGSETYCFSSSCPSCKIPLNKAKILPPNAETGGQHPRLQCDFCSATYNMKTGDRVESQGTNGIFGGVAKAIFASQSSGPLPTYALGEQGGKVLINLG